MAKLYNIPASNLEGAFDDISADNEMVIIGEIEAKVIHLPGHTPDHIGYLIGFNVFTGDSIQPRSTDLSQSTQKLLSLPPDFKLYTGHDHPPESRDVPAGRYDSGSRAVPYTTVAVQPLQNKHVKLGTDKDDFVRWRSERDKQPWKPEASGGGDSGRRARSQIATG